MRMLIEGHSDPVSAKRLGVSPRTYAGYVADLKEEFEAETRFQLGYTHRSTGHLRTDELTRDERSSRRIRPGHAKRGSDRRSLPSWSRRAGGWHWDRQGGG